MTKLSTYYAMSFLANLDNRVFVLSGFVLAMYFYFRKSIHQRKEEEVNSSLVQKRTERVVCHKVTFAHEDDMTVYDDSNTKHGTDRTGGSNNLSTVRNPSRHGSNSPSSSSSSSQNSFYHRLRNDGIEVTRIKKGKEHTMILRMNENCELFYPRKTLKTSMNLHHISTLLAAFRCDEKSGHFIVQFPQKILHLDAYSSTAADDMIHSLLDIRDHFKSVLLPFVHTLRRNNSINSTSSSSPHHLSHENDNNISMHSAGMLSDDSSCTTSTGTPSTFYNTIAETLFSNKLRFELRRRTSSKEIKIVESQPPL